jgi:dihydrodipicolinate synthase/N-acetylneuraminate lyase
VPRRATIPNVAGERITGTLAAAVTPLRDGGARLDEEALGALLEFYASTELAGLLVAGTTGEGILLSEHERRELAHLAVTGAGRVPVIVHCGAQTTRETSALAAHAAEAGADGVAVIGPPYFPLGPAELLEHFAAAARACAPLPFHVYEYADRTGYAVPVDVIEKLRERAPNLTGMKVSDAPFEVVAPYLASGIDVFIGAEAVLPEALAAGAIGAVSGVAAAFPEEVAALVAEPTTERATLVNALRGALARYPFQASVKAALAFRGVPVAPDVRAPLLPLTAGQAARLRAELERVAPAWLVRGH